jgi:hypothetical protein
MAGDPEIREGVRHLRHGLSRMYVGDQKAIFDKLPAEIKSYLWEDRIAEAVSAAGMSADKRTILFDISDCLSPVLYTRRRTTRRELVETHLNELEQRAKTIFRQEIDEFNIISTKLGAYENDTVRVLARETCQCNLKAGDCYISAYSCADWPCTPTLSGCGSWWRYGCDGLCH